MNPLVVKYSVVALEWCKRYWREAGCVLAVVFVFLQFKSHERIENLEFQLGACQEWSGAVAMRLSQTASVSTKNNVRVEVRYVKVPVPGEPGQTIFSPCPDVVWESNGESTATSEAAVEQPKNEPVKPIKPPLWAIEFGLGYLDTPFGEIELEYNKIGLKGVVGAGSVGGGLTYRAIEW